MKKFKFKIRGNNYNAVINSFEKNIIDIDINGTNYKVELEQEIVRPKTPKLVRSKVHTSKEDASIKGKIGKLVKAPLPGTIFKMKIKIGDNVSAGDTLLIMEAMKMENNIQSEISGKIKSVMVAEGDTVLQGDILLELE
ncbi:MAG: acetyl-CoA carboxylase biotin carboxyl carrier protein subunit [Bacteroidales bacterium]|nr:acetyl-CoA carboxylase biotin carboxyl carrier protein subunit [Bacteroidales bacterium]